MLWNLKVENFGRIKSADIKVSPMMIFIGDNNSGKSYLMSLLWGLQTEDFHRFLNDECFIYQKYTASRKVVHEIITNKSMNGKISADGRNKILAFFNVVLNKNLDKILKNIFNSEVKCTSIEITTADTDGVTLNQGNLKKLRDDLKSVKESNTEKFYLHIMIDFAREILFKDFMFDKTQYYNPLFLPASRTGFMLTYKTLINESLNQHFGGTSNNASRFTKPIIRFLNNLVSLSEEPNNEFSDVIEYIEKELIKGKVVKDNSPVKNIYYKSEGMNEEIPLYLTSSLVTEVSSLLLFLEDKNSHFKTLIIEEPEAHLHLKAQAMMAKILVMILNKNKNVWLTTHSDTFFQQLNNLIKYKKLPNRLEMMQKFGISESELLDIEKVKVYQFDALFDKTVVTEIEPSDSGFAGNTFNSVIDSIMHEVIELDG